jgi:hypothetical protein
VYLSIRKMLEEDLDIGVSISHQVFWVHNSFSNDGSGLHISKPNPGKQINKGHVNLRGIIKNRKNRIHEIGIMDSVNIGRPQYITSMWIKHRTEFNSLF